MELNNRFDINGNPVAALSPSDFTAHCSKVFNAYALSKNLVKGDIVFVPELVPLGEKAVLEIIANDLLQKEYGEKPMLFYYVVLEYALKTGILLGAKWELNFEGLTPDSYKETVSLALHGEADQLLAEMGLDSEAQHDEFFMELHKKWHELTLPYTKLKDQRYYISGSLFAAFQLGVTMILDSLQEE